ncbi:nitrogenase component 1 [Ureibacillus sp. FSL K6-8385]|uniref:Nitrogenase/oxidoreductase component 1 domain-containing protein n=1 Tax=Ureibacillus terrenus TaxID=118246 RepID=A0A540V6Z5_9BACL|nr:nitrogenase component 1 [Ureibacillus terrenus]MED3660478.1 nitrogenase component 1 [Ureibacillus terrenus]MED3762632.1 nitrogenase component 1 [Ureibacillus terrenus]TQE92488.1 hypothetical protein FKZ59_01910 [Ureibacillus terrenus]
MKDNRQNAFFGQHPENDRHAAEFPGAHCGLFEASFMAPLFPNSIALVIAPPSCTYHAKWMVYRRLSSPKGGVDNLFCLNLSREDLIFGVEPVIEEALEELDECYHPELIFLITTCTPEIIGFDESALTAAKRKINAKVVVVKTNGYECLHQQKGSTDFLDSLVSLMKPGKTLLYSANILGLRSANMEEVEMVRVLERGGISVNALLPGTRYIVDIENAPRAALNIVAGKIALPLAKKMESAFGIPYIFFDFSYGTEKIIKGYETIFDFFHLDLPKEIEQLSIQHHEFLESMRPKLEGITFGIGSVEGSNVDAAIFYASLGMIPKFLLTRMPIEEDADVQKMKRLGIKIPTILLKKGMDMYSIIGQFKPQLFFGHAQAEKLRKENVIQCHPVIHRSGPGFSAVQQEVANVSNLIECRKSVVPNE